MKIREVFLLVILLTGVNYEVFSQCRTFSSNTCSNIPFIICDVQALISSGTCSLSDPADYNPETDPDLPTEIPDCTSNGFSFNLQNPSWYAFIAASARATIDLEIFSCTGASTPGEEGIQYALVEDCESLEVFDCISESSGGDFSMINIEYTGLSVGKTYFFVIDGYASSVCDYSFRNITGFGNFVLEDIEGVEFEGVKSDTVCANLDSLTTTVRLDASPLQRLFSAEITSWRFYKEPDTSILFLDTIVSGIEFEYSFKDIGRYYYSVTAANSCEETNIYKDSFYLRPIETEILDTFIYCVEDLPGLIPDDPRYLGFKSVVGIDTLLIDTIFNADSCPLIQRIPLSPIMPSSGVSVDSVTCGQDLVIYEGIPFETSVLGQRLNLNNRSVYGCDSIVYLNLYMLNIEGFLESSFCDNGTSTITFNPTKITDGEFIDSIQYVWTNSSNEVVEDEGESDEQLIVTEVDTFHLEVTLFKAGVSCSFKDSIYVEPGSRELIVSCSSEEPGELLLIWNRLPNISEYLIILGVDTLAHVTDTSFLVTGLMPGTTLSLQVTAVPSVNCAEISSVVEGCSIYACPTRNEVGLNIVNPDTSFCLLNDLFSYQYEYNLNAGYEGMIHWESDGIIDDQSGLFDVALSGVGAFQIFLINEIGSCAYRDTVSAEIRQTPNSAFTIDQSICLEQSAMLLFEEDVSGDYQVNWSVEGNPTILEVDTKTYLFTWTESGNYNVSVNIGNGTCMSGETSSLVRVDPVVPDPNIICFSDFDKIKFVWNRVECGESYDIYLNGQYITNTADTMFEVTGLIEGEEVELELHIISSCLCPGNVTVKTCVAKSCPSVLVDIIEIEDICLQTADIQDRQLEVNISGHNGTGQGMWAGNGITANGVFNSGTAGVGDHRITFTFTEDDCVFQDEIQISVFEIPEFQVELFPPECPFDSLGTINIIATGGSGTFTYIVDDEEIADPISYTLKQGFHTVQVIDDRLCVAEPQTIQINSAPTISFQLNGPGTVVEGDEALFNVNLETQGLEVVASTWTLNDLIIPCSTMNCLEKIQFVPTTGGNLCVDLEFNNSCSERKCISFNFDREFRVYIPNVISLDAEFPNNQFWIYSNDPNAVVEELRIFDRWGNQLYAVFQISMEANSMGWDGTYNGERLNSGVFMYKSSIRFEDGSSESFYGDITIVK